MNLLQSHDALLLDLDGTVWQGGTAIPSAVDVINSAGLPVVYITNNSTKSPDVVAQKLQEMGIEDAKPGDVLTSAQSAVALLNARVSKTEKVLALGSEYLKSCVREAGYELVSSADDKPGAVIQGMEREIGWEQLTEAALAIREGARYYATNLDSSLPTERGLAVGNGSMVAAVVSATEVSPESAGKPGPDMFTQAAALVGAKAPLVVGDRLNTDIQGGNAAAMDTFHVLTGVSGPMELIHAPMEQRPNFIGENMTELASRGSRVAPGAHGGFTARIDGLDLLLENGQKNATSTDALRTVLEVVWAMEEPPRYIHPRSDAADNATKNWW